MSTTKCKCGCGQGNTGRLRKIECPACGWIAYVSRTRISEGLPVCHCGSVIEPVCVSDRVAVAGPIGDQAYAEMTARDTFSAIQAERGRRGAQIAAVHRAFVRGQKQYAVQAAGESVPF